MSGWSPVTVAALFVRRTSHYKSMPGVDCFDVDRDARTWRGGVPGVFHPPCRAWGKLSHFAKPRECERHLAIWSMHQVRRFGGVLEHPTHSRLWSESGCLGFGMRDTYCGVLVPVLQSWWGHRAPKQTSLYFVGCPVPDLLWPEGLPPVPSGRVEKMCTAERERTSPEFARWLVDLAASCRVSS